jgi:hypothetical protein
VVCANVIIEAEVMWMVATVRPAHEQLGCPRHAANTLDVAAARSEHKRFAVRAACMRLVRMHENMAHLGECGGWRPRRRAIQSIAPSITGHPDLALPQRRTSTAATLVVATRTQLQGRFGRGSSLYGAGCWPEKTSPAVASSPRDSTVPQHTSHSM